MSRLYLLLIAVVLCVAPARAVDLYVTPDCPSATQAVTVTAYQAIPPPGFLPNTESVTRTGNVFSLFVQGSNAIGLAPPSSANFALGTLAIGSYHIDFYVYLIDGFGNRTQQLAAASDFAVQDNPPPCTPSALRVIGPSFLETLVGTAFAQPLQVQVLDENGLPVSNASVGFFTFGPPEENTVPPPAVAGVTLQSQSTVTDSTGTASVVAVANSTPGVVEVVAQIMRAGVTKNAYFVLANRSTTTGGIVPIVEFYNQQLDHYFITSNEEEMSLMDSGQLSGWQRTGAAFLALPAGTQAIGTSQVCRFYGLPSAGLDSHFFTASPAECAEVQQRFAGSWILETPDAFDMAVPDTTTGICPPQTRPVFRVYDNRPDANHRYSTSTLIIQNMLAQGWVAEGYGPQAVVMCSPT